MAEGARPRPWPAVRLAVDRHERLEIDYYTAARDELATRRVDPEQVFSSIGNWYVVAWDHLSEDERLFRADRIREVRETGETFAPRGLVGAGRPLYTRSDRDLRVRLALAPGAGWVAEYYPIERAKAVADGWTEVTMPVKDLPWVALLILRLGGRARVLEPAELVALVERTARETLDRYRSARS